MLVLRHVRQLPQPPAGSCILWIFAPRRHGGGSGRGRARAGGGPVLGLWPLAQEQDEAAGARCSAGGDLKGSVKAQHREPGSVRAALALWCCTGIASRAGCCISVCTLHGGGAQQCKLI